MRDDVEKLYNMEGGRDFFDEKFVSTLADSAGELERREIKLIVFQFGISAFILMGYFTNDATISFFGVSLKHVSGLRELLVAISATVAVAAQAISHSKFLRLVIIDRLTELRTDSRFAGFAKLAAPAAFQLNIYIAKQHDRWIFPTKMTQILMFVLGVLLFVFFGIVFVFSIGLWIYLFLEIIRSPSLGVWSYVVVAYSTISYAICLLWIIRAYLPLPYRDMHTLQELEALKGDPVAYANRLREIFG